MRLKATRVNLTLTTTTPIERTRQIEDICLRLLARREHSRRELLDKLALRGVKREEAEPVISRLAEQNWQNDERYAQAYVRQRVARGYGPLRIAYELQQRGISDVDLDAEAEAQGGWQQLALHVYCNKYGDAAAMTQQEWLKRSRFLQQRGFGAEVIRHVFVALKIKFCRSGQHNATP